MSDPNDKTRLIRRSTSGDAGGPPPLPANYGGNRRDPEETVYGGAQSRPDNPDQTRILRRDEPAKAPEPDCKTVLVRRSSASAEPAKPVDDLPEGPVVGWLVVVEGPGRGKSVTLGYGMNTIGREPGNRVILPFGDMQISRTKHATVTYDPRGRKFFIQHGESSNLTYVGEQPVLSPIELKSGEIIRLGDTTVLKFIPLCGDEFNWD
ncbi:MAG: FHA domain-containing protein [Verrucomicrobiota bacterium]